MVESWNSVRMKLVLTLLSIIVFVLGIGFGLSFFDNKDNAYQAKISLQNDGDFILYDGEHKVQLSEYKGKAVFLLVTDR